MAGYSQSSRLARGAPRRPRCSPPLPPRAARAGAPLAEVWAGFPVFIKLNREKSVARRAPVRRLLLTGATLAGLLVAAGCGVDATAKYTDTGVTREDGFVAAAGQGDVAAVNAFLAAGVHVDARDQHGSTALMAAAGSARIDLINTLVAKGADV